MSARLKDWAIGLFIFPGFLAFLALPLVFNSQASWLITGLYFGWVGTYAYYRVHRLNA
jgi:hypothetical protein